jgi:hypothetical protein
LSEDTTHFPSHVSLVQARKNRGPQSQKIISEAERCFHLKPAKLELVTSSFYDALDKVFVHHFMKDDSLAETFLASEGRDSKLHKASFLEYADELVQEAQKYFRTRTSQAHGEAIVAQLYYYLFVCKDMHCFVPFLTQTMAVEVDQQLSQSQQGLSNVSASHSPSEIQQGLVDR